MTPPGWRLEPSNAAGFALTELRDDRVYDVTMDTADGPAVSPATVEFTLADLRSLDDGQVWAVAKLAKGPRPMTRDEFRERADDSC